MVVPLSVAVFGVRARVAGPRTTEPSATLYWLPWQAQVMVPPLTSVTRQPW
jgi:hypothetical protein